MEIYTSILGTADAPEHHDALHHLAHKHAVDVVRLSRADLARRRLRIRTDAGREVAIALPRDQKLFEGALLALKEDSALVVRVETERWIRLAPRDAAAALRLGYFCGNLHWRVRFEENDLCVAVETEEHVYLERLEGLLEEGAVTLLSDNGEAG
ncbi:urease accessory protein [Roseovarius litoreus]|uniref:Urease accessory protein n=1 Tax=Roseovarius litoreus TaxID=1155722 RepID=A0A1M7LDU0_9RHOB|nr:urease accessory protein UreE [Roseovarius litoreus]SHM76100.1 urease accessory protein [Roseovarius litoreus]